VERSAAIAAEFSTGVGCPQPMATSSALRINTLNSPSRQILHAFSSSGMRRRFFRSWLTGRVNRLLKTLTANRSGPLGQERTEKLRGFCAAALVVSREKILFLVVVLPADSCASELSSGERRNSRQRSSGSDSVWFWMGQTAARPKKRAASTKPATNKAWWFCSGRSVPCLPGRNGHLYGPTESLPIFFPPLQLLRACPQSVLLTFESKGQAVLVCGKGCGAPSLWRSSRSQSCLQPGRSNNQSKAGIQTSPPHLNLLVAQLLRAKRKRAKTPRLLIRLYPSFTNFGIAKTICCSQALAGRAPWTMLRH
jgi:hypothetical protein